MTITKILTAFLALTITVSHARQITELSGPWAFTFEKEATQSVLVPHTWNTPDGHDGDPGSTPKRVAFAVQTDTGFKRGTGTYGRTLPTKPQEGKRCFLHFEGVSQLARVLINDQEVGTHKGAFTGFSFEITDFLKQGNKGGYTLTVEANNKIDPTLLPLAGDFTLYGGLYRGVQLIETSTLCISPLFYGTPGVLIEKQDITPESGKLTLSIHLSDKSESPKDVTLTTEVLDPAGKIVATEQKSISAADVNKSPVSLEVSVPKPRLWQGPADPVLYTIRTTVTDGTQSDTVQIKWGFRDIKMVPGKGFFLNGKKMVLRGVNRHQDIEGKGWAISKEDEAKDVKDITDMGADAVRTAHYAHSQNMYDLYDSAGLIVWTEISAVERVRDNPEFLHTNRQQIAEIVYQLKNHPSVCMYGVFNEMYHQNDATDKDIDMLSTLRKFNDWFHEFDPTRPTVAGTNRIANKELNTIPDALALNCYPGWYGGMPPAMEENFESLMPYSDKQAVGISEYGHGASIKHHENPASKPVPTSEWHPEEWQSIGHEGNLIVINRHQEIWGTYIWNMFDFGSDTRSEGDRHGVNDKGLVTFDRSTRKDAYYLYKANWNPAPIVFITSRRFTVRQQPQVPVKVYSNADIVTLYVNGVKIADGKPDSIKRVVWENVTLAPGKNFIVVHAMKDGKPMIDNCEWFYDTSKPPVEVDKFRSRP